MSTAARVLSSSTYPVDDGMRQMVLAAADELGYVPNMLARSLRGGAPTTVGLVIGDILDPYYGEIASVITTQSEAAHSMLAIVCNMQRDPALEIRYCRQLWGHRVAGLILAGGAFDQRSHFAELSQLLPQIRRSGVVVTTLSPRGLDIDGFYVDNREAGAQAAAEIVRLGHKKVGVILGLATNEVNQLRLAGTADVLSRAGVEFHIVNTGYSPDFGSQAMNELMNAFPDVTAVIGGSYRIAMSAVSWLEGKGRSIPADVSVIGIGSVKAWRLDSRRLTTVDLQLGECGAAALDFIAHKVKGDETPAPRAFRPKLVAGDTVGPPAGG